MDQPIVLLLDCLVHLPPDDSPPLQKVIVVHLPPDAFLSDPRLVYGFRHMAQTSERVARASDPHNSDTELLRAILPPCVRAAMMTNHGVQSTLRARGLLPPNVGIMLDAFGPKPRSVHELAMLQHWTRKSSLAMANVPS